MKPKTKPRRAPGIINPLADALQVTPRRVRQLLDDGMPEDIEGALKWRGEQPSGGSSDAADLRRQRIRLTKAQAERAELLVEIEKGKYISRDEVKAHHQANGSAVCAALRRLESDIPPAVVGLDEAAAQVAIRPILAEILTMLNDGQSSFWIRRPEPKPPQKIGEVSRG